MSESKVNMTARRLPLNTNNTHRSITRGTTRTTRTSHDDVTPNEPSPTNSIISSTSTTSNTSNTVTKDDTTSPSISNNKPSKKKRKRNQYSKPPQAPKRFKSAFIFYTIFRHSQLRKELEGSNTANATSSNGGNGVASDGEDAPLMKTGDVAKIISKEWKKLPPADRRVFEEKARVDKERWEYEKSNYNGPWKVAKVKDPTAPKRPPSAFLLFSIAKRKNLKRNKEILELSEENDDSRSAEMGISRSDLEETRLTRTMTNTEITKYLSKIWNGSNEEDRRSFVENEKELRSKHKIEMAAWKKKTEEEQVQVSRNVSEEEGTIPVHLLPHDYSGGSMSSPMITIPSMPTLDQQQQFNNYEHPTSYSMESASHSREMQYDDISTKRSHDTNDLSLHSSNSWNSWNSKTFDGRTIGLDRNVHAEHLPSEGKGASAVSPNDSPQLQYQQQQKRSMYGTNHDPYPPSPNDVSCASSSSSIYSGHNHAYPSDPSSFAPQPTPIKYQNRPSSSSSRYHGQEPHLTASSSFQHMYPQGGGEEHLIAYSQRTASGVYNKYNPQRNGEYNINQYSRHESSATSSPYSHLQQQQQQHHHHHQQQHEQHEPATNRHRNVSDVSAGGTTTTTSNKRGHQEHKEHLDLDKTFLDSFASFDNEENHLLSNNDSFGCGDVGGVDGLSIHSHSSAQQQGQQQLQTPGRGLEDSRNNGTKGGTERGFTPIPFLPESY